MSSMQQIFEDPWGKAGAEVRNFVGHGVLLNENKKVMLLHRAGTILWSIFRLECSLFQKLYPVRMSPSLYQFIQFFVTG